jgi:hypothetical protein
MEFLENLVNYKPDLLLIEGNLNEILSKINFVDFITFVSKYPTLYDNLQKNQSYWKSFYLKHNPHFPTEKEEFNESLEKVTISLDIDWFQQCCIQKDIFFFNATNQITSPFNVMIWDEFILESLSQEQKTYIDGSHDLEENLKRPLLSKLHNIKQIITRPFYSYDDDEDEISEHLYNTSTIILFEDEKLYYYVETKLEYDEEGNVLDIDPTYEVKWLLNHVKSIHSIYYEDNEFYNMILVQTKYNDFYLIIISNLDILYMRKLIIEKLYKNYSVDEIIQIKKGELEFTLLQWRKGDNYTFVLKDSRNNIYLVGILSNNQNLNNGDYLLSNDDLIVKSYWYTSIEEMKIMENQLYDLDEPLPDRDERDIRYEERDISYEEQEENHMEIDYEKKEIGIIWFYIINLFVESEDMEGSLHNLEIYLDTNYELHYLLFHNESYLQRKFDYNLSQYDPIIKQLKIQKVTMLKGKNEILQIYHEDGILWLHPIKYETIIVEMVRELEFDDTFDYIDFLSKYPLVVKTEINPNREDIISSYKDAKDVSKIKDCIIIEKNLPNYDHHNYEVYILDVLGNVFTFRLKYIKYEKFGGISNLPIDKILSFENFHLIVNNATKFIYNEMERIFALEIDVNKYVIVPYEHYLRNKYLNKILDELPSKLYLLFTLIDSNFYYKVYFP